MTFTQQQALSFLQGQIETLEAEVYEIRYEDIIYSRLIDTDASANPYTNAISFMSMERTGEAKLITPRSTDIPNADVSMGKSTEPVFMAGIGYEFDFIELQQASMGLINLDTERANSAFRAYEEFMNKVALTGVPGVQGSTGLLNNVSVPRADAAATGTGSATTFESKTLENILIDINAALNASYVTSGRRSIANTIALPPSTIAYLASKFFQDTGKTFMQQLQEANVLKSTTGEDINFVPVTELETAGSGGTKRMLTYRKERRAAVLHTPMPHMFLDVMQVPGTLIYKRPGIFRTAGVDIRDTSSFRYTDGI